VSEREESDAAGAGPVGGASHPARGLAERPILVIAGATLVLALPLLVAAVVLHSKHWYPVLDMAGTEMRVRDVWTTRPPLVGLFGRIGSGSAVGNHPGPLSFYALWSVWRLFGGSSFGLQAANVALDIAAIACCITIAWRRGGLALVVGVGTMLAVLMHGYGIFMLTLPWNPYLPVLWWVVFLLAAWSVLADDLVMLPVAAFAGAMCAQTHISYLGLVGGVSLFVLVVLAVASLRGPRSERWRHLAFWLLAAVLVSAVIWAPPLIDELLHSPGNATTIFDYFRHPPKASIGLGRGLEVVLQQMNPVKLFQGTLVHDVAPPAVSGSWVPGALLLLVWAVSFELARRLRHALLLRLDAVLGVAFLLGVASAGRIFGEVFFYLVLWAWGIAALMLFATGWLVAVVVARRSTSTAVRARDLAVVGASVLALVLTGLLVSSATGIDVQLPEANDPLRVLTPGTARAMSKLEKGGYRAPFLVTWRPSQADIGAVGYGLVNELERRGFKVRADSADGKYVPDYGSRHVVDPSKAAIEVHLATDRPNVIRWSADPRFREVAFYDPRLNLDHLGLHGVAQRLVKDLQRAGFDQVGRYDYGTLALVYITPGVPKPLQQRIAKLLALGPNRAVFIGPTGGGPDDTQASAAKSSTSR
jgi:hypothetical protein